MRFDGKAVTLVIASTLVSLVAAEGIIRLFVEPTPRFVEGFRLSKSGYYIEDAELGWVPRPGVRGVHNRNGSFESSFSTNSLGYRDEERAASSRGDSRRIVVLGDSFAWGYGVNDGDIFARVMEELDPRIDAVNLGVTAYSLWQEIAYFERHRESINPDIVILALVMNDITDPNRKLPGETTEDWKTRIGGQTHDRDANKPVAPSANGARNRGALKAWLADRSVLYQVARDVVNASKPLVDFLVYVGIKKSPVGLEGLDPALRPFLEVYPEAVRDSIERSKLELLKLRDRVLASGSEFLVVVVPPLQSVVDRARRNSIAHTRYYEDDFDLNKPFHWLQEFGESSNIEILNVVDAFRRAHDNGVVLYLPNDMHFSAAGHRLFAEEIVNYLSERKWLN